MQMRHAVAAFGVAATATLGLSGAAPAQNAVEEFYKGRNLDLVVGYNPGGGYDAYTRLLGRHMSRHIPGNPKLIVKNMGGAASLKAANFFYNVAKRDGTVFGLFAGGIAVDALIGGKKTNFDPREFNWLGSITESSSACWAWHTSGFKSIKDVMTKEMIVGATSGGSSTGAWPKAMNSFLGTKFKIVTGYKGSKGVILAIERGEVQGICGYFISSIRNVRPDWLKDKKVTMLVQEARVRHPDYPDVPTVFEYAKNEESKKAFNLIFGWQVLGRPYLLPPKVPADRVAAMRKAFWDTMQDKAFLDDAKKRRLKIEPRTWKQVQAYLDDAWKTPKPVIQSVFKALGRDKAKKKKKK
ncbi:MAG: tripartite tricarboxylate transporter substrate-binding protein [Alphaproteobacteria bacterium]|nr:tripartite tricarboxylate transporter substrate-binding protein [Alphaproteobacteria bacterium]